ncbi:MAG: DUF6268 family outer membrane beta-barrel protein [Flavobacteriaceae bacterium]|nr:DUF6268 family outer membrane beta-barrel protein [Flavobacteriaceae bacterium]
MKKLLLLLLFISFFSEAQEYIDILKTGYSYTSNAKFEGSNESTDVNSFEAGVTFPIILNDKYALITGINFSTNQLFLSPNYNQTTNLYSTLLKIGVATTHSEKWSSTIVFLPKISSDYKNLSGDDFYFGGFAVAKLKKSEHFKYRFGLYASTEAFGLFATPIFGFYYLSPSKRLEIDASLPISADINYRFGKAAVGIDYFGIGRSYNISQETSIPVYIEQSPLEFTYYFQYGILKNSILLRAKVGYSSNIHEVYEQGDKLDFRLSAFSFGDDRTQLNPDILGSLFFKMEAIYRIHFKEKKK